MTHVAATRRPSAAARRAGYVLAAVVNSVLLYLVNVRPGWQAVPFLTEDADRVVGLFNVSLAAGIVANLVYGLHDPDWLRSSGQLVTSAISLVVLVRVWQVFPFDFGAAPFNWALVARVVLAVATAAVCVDLVVRLVSLARAAKRSGDGPRRGRI